MCFVVCHLDHDIHLYPTAKSGSGLDTAWEATQEEEQNMELETQG